MHLALIVYDGFHARLAILASASPDHMFSFAQVVQSFVKQALGYVDQTPDKETKIELIKTLQSVTEGKV